MTMHFVWTIATWANRASAEYVQRNQKKDGYSVDDFGNLDNSPAFNNKPQKMIDYEETDSAIYVSYAPYGQAGVIFKYIKG